MNIVSGIVVFLLLWWTVLFTVLPFGARMNDLPPEKGIQAAPENPYLKKKLLITTAISALLWLVVYLLIKIDIIDFRELAGQMAAHDRL